MHVILILFLLLLSGCGQEAPPRQADAPFPFAERDAQGRIVLRWDDAPAHAPLQVFRSASPDAIDRTTPVALMKSAELVLPAPRDPFERPYFSLENKRGRWIAAQRNLPLDGLENLRDLGGYPTTDGRFTRWGLVYRSENLHDLSDSDVRYLKGLGIRLVCDFRGPKESADEADRTLEGVEAKALRIFDQDFSLKGGIRQIVADGDLENAKFETFLVDANRDFVEKYASRFAPLFELLAQPDRTPLLFHCTTGKDRTGFAAALLLSALGVPKEIIMRDYLLSNLYLRKRTENYVRMIRLGTLFRLGAEQIRPLFEVRPEYLEAAYAAIEKHYGSMDAFLRDGVGLSDEQKQALRARLLYDPLRNFD